MELDALLDVVKSLGCTLEFTNRIGSKGDLAALAAFPQIDLDLVAKDLVALGLRHSGRRRNGVLFQLPEGWLKADAELVTSSADWLIQPGLVGKRFLVQFLDPNLVKPLHAGHLRNVAAGWSIAKMLEIAGGTVLTRCVACDYGRAVAEAIAGLRELGGGQSIGAPHMRQPPDEYVGECYREYHRTHPPAGPAPDDDYEPVPRETSRVGDEAEALLLQLHGRSQNVVTDRTALVGWAQAGQVEVLADYGVTIDSWCMESDTLTIADELLRRGLDSAVFRVAPDGGVHFATGLEEFPELRLTRDDRVETEHLRALAAWWTLCQTADFDSIIHVFGEEWLHATRARIAAMKALGSPIDPARYKMVAQAHLLAGDGAKISSSAPEAGTMRFIREKCTRAELVALWLGLLLADFEKPLVLERAALPTARAASWLVALGADSTHSSSFDAECQIDRYAMLQAYRLRAVLAACLETARPQQLVRWMVSTAHVVEVSGSPCSVLAGTARAAASAVGAEGLLQ